MHFPFVDGVETLVQNGVSAIIQPSGSIRDKEIIKYADKMGIILVFSKTRHLNTKFVYFINFLCENKIAFVQSINCMSLYFNFIYPIRTIYPGGDLLAQLFHQLY